MAKQSISDISEYDVFKKFKDEKMDRMEIHIKQTQTDIKNMEVKIDKIFTSVVGNKEMGNVGIAERLDKAEETDRELKKEIESLKENKIINGVYIKQMLAVGAIVFTFIIIFYLKSRVK